MDPVKGPPKTFPLEDAVAVPTGSVLRKLTIFVLFIYLFIFIFD